jgi:hypothetical protein
MASNISNILNILNIFSNTPVIWPDSKPMDLDNSYVWTMDKKLKYLPDTGETNIDTMGYVVVLYLILWALLFYWRIVYSKLSIVPLVWGLIVGLIIFYGKHILYGLSINVLHPVLNPIPSIKLINSPKIIDYKKGDNNPLKDNIDKFVGDYKVLLENKVLPISETDGYIISARTYLNYEKDGKIIGKDLVSFLKESSCTTCKGYDQDIQHQAIPFSKKVGNIETLVFYLGILILTFAIYISDANTKLFKIANNKKFLFWVILVLLVITIVPGFGIILPGLQNVSSLESLIDLKENLAIIGISFAVTTVLIV